jgi:phosphinothricin acetyltransferase
MNLEIRLALEADAEGIHAIYAPIVLETPVSFALEPPAVTEVREQIKNTLTVRPWVVLIKGDTLLGYATAAPHRARPAYQWCVETSIYVAAGQRGRGLGRGLYTSLLNLLRLQGFHNAYGVITLPNPASVALHESLGFRQAGLFEAQGFKLGAWHDVGWWHLALQKSRSGAPEPPMTLEEAQKKIGWIEALRSGLELFD